MERYLEAPFHTAYSQEGQILSKVWGSGTQRQLNQVFEHMDGVYLDAGKARNTVQNENRGNEVKGCESASPKLRWAKSIERNIERTGLNSIWRQFTSSVPWSQERLQIPRGLKWKVIRLSKTDITEGELSDSILWNIEWTALISFVASAVSADAIS
jgi:hypothetical protein